MRTAGGLHGEAAQARKKKEAGGAQKAGRYQTQGAGGCYITAGLTLPRDRAQGGGSSSGHTGGGREDSKTMWALFFFLLESRG